MAVRVRRIPGSQPVPAVEGQEGGPLPLESGRHEHLLGVESEMHHRAAQGHVLRVAITPVLSLGVVNRLAGERVLQLSGGDRDPIDEEAKVDRLV